MHQRAVKDLERRRKGDLLAHSDACPFCPHFLAFSKLFSQSGQALPSCQDRLLDDPERDETARKDQSQIGEGHSSDDGVREEKLGN
jgi:hypothetical protein